MSDNMKRTTKAEQVKVMTGAGPNGRLGSGKRPSRDEAEAAVRTLLAWAGDDPTREGLLGTPRRVVEAYEEYFSGYKQKPDAALDAVFEDVGGYGDMVFLRDIRVESHCEHHIAPFIGVAHIGYVPDGRVVGLSKLARLVEVYAHRLQTQEKLTAQIAGALMTELRPRGVAVLISAEHTCMSLRGVRHHGVRTVTTQFEGVIKSDRELRERFLSYAGVAARGAQS